jgi:creatinine amidohydrolase
LAQSRRAGFRVVVADGHGPSRAAFGEHAPAWEQQLGLRLLVPGHGLPRGNDRGMPWRSQVDHAAKNETSLMLALHPALVDLSQLPADRSVWPQGVSGEDPRDASAAHGEACLAACLAAIEVAVTAALEEGTASPATPGSTGALAQPTAPA